MKGAEEGHFDRGEGASTLAILKRRTEVEEEGKGGGGGLMTGLRNFEDRRVEKTFFFLLAGRHVHGRDKRFWEKEGKYSFDFSSVLGGNCSCVFIPFPLRMNGEVGSLEPFRPHSYPSPTILLFLLCLGFSAGPFPPLPPPPREKEFESV